MLQRSIDLAAIEAEIERVRSLSGNALRRRWQAVFGRSVPEHLTAGLLRRMIANRVQEEAFGTLDRATLQLLDGLARRSRIAERNLKIGTVLVRDYQGRRHTVTVQADGYVWEGKPYSSLSAVARAITGTAWSGPRFFALRSSDRSNAPPDAMRGRGAARQHKSQLFPGTSQPRPDDSTEPHGGAPAAATSPNSPEAGAAAAQAREACAPGAGDGASGIQPIDLTPM
jgi:hypothetical protein